MASPIGYLGLFRLFVGQKPAPLGGEWLQDVWKLA
jgi:hypothetical protein